MIVALERTEDPDVTRTYVIMLYRQLQWDRADEPADVPPVVGVSDGRGNVIDFGPIDDVNSTLIDDNDPGTYGGNAGIIVFRVDGDSFDEYRVFDNTRTVVEQGK